MLNLQRHRGKEQLEALDVHKTVVGRACRRAHLERFYASADHKPRIDQHQRRELRPRNRKTTSNIQMLARARPFRVSFSII